MIKKQPFSNDEDKNSKKIKFLSDDFFYNNSSIEIQYNDLQIENLPHITKLFRLLISGDREFKISIQVSNSSNILVIEKSLFSNDNLTQFNIKETWMTHPIIFIALQLALESENISIDIFEWVVMRNSFMYVNHISNNSDYQIAIKNFILSPPDFGINVNLDTIDLIRIYCVFFLENHDQVLPTLDKNLYEKLIEKINNECFLHQALKNCNPRFFNLLFKLVNKQPKKLLDKDNNTLLHLYNEDEYQEQILSLVNIDAQNIDGDTALHCAARTTKLDRILFLVSHGAKVDILNKDNKTAVDLLEKNISFLLYEAFHEQDIKFIDFLKEVFKEKKIDFYDDWSDSFLHKVKDEKFFEYALKLTGNVDYQNKYGETPLLVAIKDKQLKKQQFLLENGADPFIKNNNGEFLIDLVTEELKYSIYSMIGKVLLPAPRVFYHDSYKCGIYAVKNSANYHYSIAPSLFSQPILPARKNDVTPKSESSIHKLAKELNITHAGPIFKIESLAKLIEKVGCIPVIREPKSYEEFMEFIIKAIDLSLPLIIPCGYDGQRGLIDSRSDTPHWVTIIGYCNKTSTHILIAHNGKYQLIDAKTLYDSFHRKRNTTYAPFSLIKNKKNSKPYW